MALKPDPHAYPPRGMSREDAAHYIGVGPSKFDEMVADKRMPKPRRVDARTIWDRVELDLAFAELPKEKVGLEKMLADARAAAANQRS